MNNEQLTKRKGFTPHHFQKSRKNGLFRGFILRNMKNGAGFTLIELLVGITIFAILMSVMIGILVSGIKVQRQFLSQQDALNQLSFVIEYMSRALRMAKKEGGEGCILVGNGYNYENPGANISAIRFINHLQTDECQQFFLEGTTLKYQRGIESAFALTSPNIQVESLKFQLSGQDETDNFQPRVTIFIEARPNGFPSTIKLQTTISQRNLDEN